MTDKLMTERYLECPSFKDATEARLSLHLSKCHIVGNHMSWLIFKPAPSPVTGAYVRSNAYVVLDSL